jgi:hypothetical protein
MTVELCACARAVDPGREDVEGDLYRETLLQPFSSPPAPAVGEEAVEQWEKKAVARVSRWVIAADTTPLYRQPASLVR